MSMIIAELEGLDGVGIVNKKPRYLIRGTRRKILKKAYRELQSLVSQDNREGLRAEKLGYTPLYATGEAGSKEVKALQTVLNRLAAAIAVKG